MSQNNLRINSIPSYIPALDGVRAFAVLAVMFHHLFVTNYFEYGWIGVQVFFVLSGFLISTILINSKESENYFKVFYVRRFLRIFPIYYLALLAVYFYTISHSLSSSDFYQYLLYVQNYKIGWSDKSMAFPIMFNHTWSLAIEEQFYLFWPLIIWLIPIRKLIPILTGIITFSILFKLVVFWYYPYNRFNYMNTISNLDSLSVGALIAVSVLYYEAARILRWLFILSIIFTITYFSFSYLLGMKVFYEHIIELASLEWLFFYCWLLPVIALLVFSIIMANNRYVKMIFCNPVILYVGKISYGLYLYHYIVYHVLERNKSYFDPIFSSYSIPYSVLKLAASFVLAIISWHFVEQVLLKYKKNFSYKYKNSN